MKYTIIKSIEQYNDYCDTLFGLTKSNTTDQAMQDEIDLLTLLIEKWDEEHNTLKETDPVQLLKSLMADHKLKAKDLAEILHVSKGLVSDILHYRKGFSKEVIRTLSEHFKLRQEAFNRPYKLISPLNSHLKKVL